MKRNVGQSLMLLTPFDAFFREDYVVMKAKEKGIDPSTITRTTGAGGGQSGAKFKFNAFNAKDRDGAVRQGGRDAREKRKREDGDDGERGGKKEKKVGSSVGMRESERLIDRALSLQHSWRTSRSPTSTRSTRSTVPTLPSSTHPRSISPVRPYSNSVTCPRTGSGRISNLPSPKRVTMTSS
jgi:hypothetical protein